METDRQSQAAATEQALGIQDEELAAAYPEFAEIKRRFVYGEVWQQGDLDARRRMLVTIASLTTVAADRELETQLGVALAQHLEPVELQEVFHQLAPYIGFARAEQGLNVLRHVLEAQDVAPPLQPQGSVTEQDRLERGIAAQKSIFGPAIDAMRANAPAEQRFVQDALSAYCFGDTYTRGGLDLPTRELLTWVGIISLGGADSQAKSHVAGNLAVGNGPDVLLGAVTQCLPWIGFPRSLNALAALGEVLATRSQQD